MTLARLARIVRQRLRTLLHRETVDRELDRELAFHLEAMVAEKIAEGLPPREARRAALKTLGNVVVIGEECRDARGLGWIDDLRQDFIHGFRVLRASPALTIAAACSLALGIGAETAVLRALEASLVDGLGLADGDRYVAVQSVSPSRPAVLAGPSPLDYVAWRDGARSFAAIGASTTGDHTIGADAGQPAERIHGIAITAGGFAAMGVRPLFGREFADDEARLINPRNAAIISFALWQRRFGSDPGVLSRQVRVDGVWRPIVGVMPADMPRRDMAVDCWLPLRMIPNEAFGSGRGLRVTGRLKPGVSLAQATTDLDAMAAGLGRRWPDRFAGWTVSVERLDDARFGWARDPLEIVGAVAALVLLIACVNVSGLLLARATTRDPEMAIRLALGASRGRLVRQLLAEGLLLGAIGGAASLAVAWIGMRALAAFPSPPGKPPIPPFGLDGRTALLAALLAIAAAALFALVPALILSGRRPAAPSRARARTILAALQLAITFVLLVAAGLLAGSLWRLMSRDLHFAPDGLLTFAADVPEPRRSLGLFHGQPYLEVTRSPAETLAKLADAVRRVPGITSVAGSSFRAIDALAVPHFDVRTSDRMTKGLTGEFVTPGYFTTMGTPILQGRDIDDDDRVDAPWVAVVNAAAARMLWPGADPIGQRLLLDTVPDDRPRVVVGVVADIPLRHGRLDPDPIVYPSFEQEPSRYRAPWLNLFGTMTFVARYTGDWTTVAAGVRRAAAEVDPDLPIASLATVSYGLAVGRGELQTMAAAAIVLGMVGLFLALVGIYGVMACAVNRQTREIAIRKSLGARPAHVVSLVARLAGTIVGVGLGAGVGAALPLARRLGPFLWGVTAADPATYVVAATTLVAAAAAACVGPAWRAMRIDPAIALRVE